MMPMMTTTISISMSVNPRIDRGWTFGTVSMFSPWNGNRCATTQAIDAERFSIAHSTHCAPQSAKLLQFSALWLADAQLLQAIEQGTHRNAQQRGGPAPVPAGLPQRFANHPGLRGFGVMTHRQPLVRLARRRRA